MTTHSCSTSFVTMKSAGLLPLAERALKYVNDEYDAIVKPEAEKNTRIRDEHDAWLKKGSAFVRWWKFFYNPSALL